MPSIRGWPAAHLRARALSQSCCSCFHPLHQRTEVRRHQAIIAGRSMLASNEGSVTAALPRLDLPPANANQRYPASVPSWARPKSPSSSIRSRSSRSGSPVNQSKHSQDPSSDTEEDVLALSAGCQPDEVYKLSMPAWRYQIRKTLVRGVEWESPILSKIQVLHASY